MQTDVQEGILQREWDGGRSPFAVNWGKLMMWLFLLSDAFIFGGLLTVYGASRLANPNWPDTGHIFALHLFGREIPLLLIAFMTFVLISSSGTMAIAVYHAHHRHRQQTVQFLLWTIVGGLIFLGCQAYEWSHLILEGVRPWSNPWGAPQFGASFFTLTGFHGLHVLSGVIYLGAIAARVARGIYERRGSYEGVEIVGLYWHFVDLVWVFIFTFFYLF